MILYLISFGRLQLRAIKDHEHTRHQQPHGIVIGDQDGQMGTPDLEEWGNVTFYVDTWKMKLFLFNCYLLVLTSTLSP